MSFGLYCVFAIETKLITDTQKEYLANLPSANVYESENQDTGNQQTICDFFCSNKNFDDDEMTEIVDLINANEDTCGGLAYSDELGIHNGLFEYGEPGPAGITLSIEYKW